MVLNIRITEYWLIIDIPMSKQILNEKIKRNLNVDKNGSRIQSYHRRTNE